MTDQSRIIELENELNLMKEKLYRLCACLYPQSLGEDELEYIATGKQKGRAEGEWIIVKDEKWGDNVKCPFCGKEIAGTDLNFCCKCGAKLTGSEKMNGGAE